MEIGFNVKSRNRPSIRVATAIGFALSLLLGCLYASLFGDPPFYVAEPTRGRVLDESNGIPIEGAVVVAEWIVTSVGIGASGHTDRMRLAEARTNADGNYQIGGWGPRPRMPLTYLDELDPQLLVVATGFYPRRLTNQFLSDANHNRRFVRRSDWDTKDIKLKRFDGDWATYREAFSSVWSPISGCSIQCPKLIVALDAISNQIKTLAPVELHVLQIVEIRDFSESAQVAIKEGGR